MNAKDFLTLSREEHYQLADRALHVCEYLLKAATELGWVFEAPQSRKNARGSRATALGRLEIIEGGLRVGEARLHQTACRIVDAHQQGALQVAFLEPTML